MLARLWRRAREHPHWPLYWVLLASSASYATVLVIHVRSLPPRFYLLGWFWIMFVLGWAGYYLWFEYFWHRFIMHYRFTFKRPRWLAELLRRARENHVMKHHRTFPGENFTIKTERIHSPEERRRLKEVISPPRLFPTLFATHYLFLLSASALLFITGCLGNISWGAALLSLVGFLGGITWGYEFFETIHWCAHVPGMLLDRILLRSPILGPWQEMKDHHRKHHEVPKRRFNFSYPFPGDVLFGTLDDDADDCASRRQ